MLSNSILVDSVLPHEINPIGAAAQWYAAKFRDSLCGSIAAGFNTDKTLCSQYKGCNLVITLESEIEPNLPREMGTRGFEKTWLLELKSVMRSQMRSGSPPRDVLGVAVDAVILFEGMPTEADSDKPTTPPTPVFKDDDDNYPDSEKMEQMPIPVYHVHNISRMKIFFFMS